jgi:putative chitinase
MPVLKQGSKGKAVTALQTSLKKLGFDPNGVDGKFGPGTKTALIAFQKSKKLKADGMAGPKTMAALERALTPSAAVPDSVPVSVPSPPPGAPFAALNLIGLKGLLPNSVIAQIPETALKFGITSDLRLAHFLAQCALESVEFTATVENLKYRAARLLAIFPKYFRGVDPGPYANNPAKIANRVYANRMGNGNEASGDGFKFRGRGYIQLTGKNNYTSFTSFIGEDCVANPDLVATKYPLASAGFFFDSNNIWPVCDRGANDATVLAVSTRVNGKNPHAVAERTRYFKKFFKALTG